MLSPYITTYAPIGAYLPTILKKIKNKKYRKLYKLEV
jgi:hypothetical protein